MVVTNMITSLHDGNLLRIRCESLTGHESSHERHIDLSNDYVTVIVARNKKIASRDIT